MAISKKQGDNIALKYNHMVVATLMLQEIPEELNTAKDVEDYVARWNNHGYEANCALRVMGITPIGFSFVASNGG